MERLTEKERMDIRENLELFIDKTEEIKRDFQNHSREDVKSFKGIHDAIKDIATKQEDSMRQMQEMSRKIDSWLDVASSISVTGKLFLKVLGVCVAVAAGIAAIKYLLIGLLK